MISWTELSFVLVGGDVIRKVTWDEKYRCILYGYVFHFLQFFSNPDLDPCSFLESMPLSAVHRTISTAPQHVSQSVVYV